MADGHLRVDGKVIYQMNDFSIRLAERLSRVYVAGGILDFLDQMIIS